jgi:hypothetical protein
VKKVENTGLPELTSDQTEKLCLIAEQAARKHVHSKIRTKDLETLNISAGVKGEKPLTLSVEVDITLTPQITDIDTKELAKKAVKKAFASAEKYLKELKCRSQK